MVDIEYKKKFGSPIFKLTKIPNGNRQKDIDSERYKNNVRFLKIEFEKNNVLGIKVINKKINFGSSQVCTFLVFYAQGITVKIMIGVIIFAQSYKKS